MVQSQNYTIYQPSSANEGETAVNCAADHYTFTKKNFQAMSRWFEHFSLLPSFNFPQSYTKFCVTKKLFPQTKEEGELCMR